jgi:hypothetical protein
LTAAVLVLAIPDAVAAPTPAEDADAPRRVPAPRDVIALCPIDVASGVNVSRADLESAVMKGLAVAGRPVVTPDDAAARARGKVELTCESPECWSRLGALTSAGYLVSGSAAREGENFRVRFRLVRATDGSTVATEDNQCDAGDCSVAELARRSARELVRQTLGRASAEQRDDPTVPGARPAAPVASAVQSAPDRGPSPTTAQGGRWVWPVLAGVGAAGIAAGVWFIVGNEIPLFGPIDHEHGHDKLWGTVAIGSGVVLGAVSLYYMLHDGDQPGPRVALGIGPAGISAAGRF